MPDGMLTVIGEGKETGGMLVVPERGLSELLNEPGAVPGAVPVGTGRDEFNGKVNPLLGAVDSGG